MAYTIYTDGCLTPDQVIAFATGSDLVTEDEGWAMVAHLDECATCERAVDDERERQNSVDDPIPPDLS